MPMPYQNPVTGDLEYMSEDNQYHTIITGSTYIEEPLDISEEAWAKLADEELWD